MERVNVVEIPEPIGEVFCHRYRNGTVEHHETPWRYGFASCGICGAAAEVSVKKLNEFINDEVLMDQFCEKE